MTPVFAWISLSDKRIFLKSTPNFTKGNHQIIVRWIPTYYLRVQRPHLQYSTLWSSISSISDRVRPGGTELAETGYKSSGHVEGEVYYHGDVIYCHVMLYTVTWCYILSRDVKYSHAMLNNVMWCLMTWRDIMHRHVTSYKVTWRHIRSRDVI